MGYKDENTKSIWIVEKGNTLTGISKATGVRIEELIRLNNIKNRDLIYIGQELKLIGEPTKVTTNSNMVTIIDFGLMADRDYQVYVTWDWKKLDTTENYHVIWYEQRSDKQWFTASDETTPNNYTMESVYNGSAEIIAVKVKIMPIATTKDDTDTPYYTGQWTAEKVYYFKDNPPPKLSAPTIEPVEGNDNKLKVKITGLDINKTQGVEFRVIQDEVLYTYKEIKPYAVITDFAGAEWDVDSGHTYRVQCRGYRVIDNSNNKVYGEWSEYSDVFCSKPITPSILETSAYYDKNSPSTSGSVQVTWTLVKKSKKYRLEYISRKEAEEAGIDLNSVDKDSIFKVLGAPIKSVEVEFKDDETKNIDRVTRTISGVEIGTLYYLRIISISSSNKDSDPSSAVTFVIGTEPSAPTTWSSRSDVIAGEDLKLYFIHNSEDGSNLTGAKVYFTYYKDKECTEMIYESESLVAQASFTSTDVYTDTGIITSIHRSDPDNPNDKTYVIELDTSYINRNTGLKEGTTIRWYVQTAGLILNAYSEKSITREFSIYKQPEVIVALQNADGTALNVDNTDAEVEPYPNILTGLPLKVVATVGNLNNQAPTGYHISIVSESEYDTVDNVGNNKRVVADTVVYSKYYETNTSELVATISANDVDLVNNARYKLYCTVALDSSLNVESMKRIKVAWTVTEYSPFAEITINKDNVSAYIRPYIESESETGIIVEDRRSGVLLSVYRREADGSFTEIETGIQNGGGRTCVDPHPALNYARYRIIAMDETTGSISFTDLPGHYIGEKSIIIQWDEAWRSLDSMNTAVMNENAWSGSLLRLPYNISVSNNNNKDVSLVSYAGRKRPVSYYGTQLGESASWSTVIPKSDVETLYAIRRLAVWMGNVYVREPEGTGYWATISISHNYNYSDLTIPISINITPVEGGM